MLRRSNSMPIPIYSNDDRSETMVREQVIARRGFKIQCYSEAVAEHEHQHGTQWDAELGEEASPHSDNDDDCLIFDMDM